MKARARLRSSLSTQASETCDALVSELMAASPRLPTMRPGSKLPSLEATEDIGSRACETHSSLGATAMESELKVIADRREKLGDTLSTQEVLAQQVASHKNAEPVAQVQERKVRASVRELVKNGRLRQSASCRRALPPLTRRAVMVELYARKAVDRRRELSHGRGA
mmetsp:Transcript_82979/g.199110  ORF Transcript_82979/g.199110 Transcript_82979/m.199110 type:complete len:166 (+) Transcript_82979:94-591(+)